MKCFYHHDLDGKCAGYWVNKLAVRRDIYRDEFIQVDYREPLDINYVRWNEQVYIVDYSIPPAQMEALMQITTDITWIDHHVTAIDKYEDFSFRFIKGVREVGTSGCLLTFNYLQQLRIAKDYPDGTNMVPCAPYFTKLINDWDLSTFMYGDATRYFQLGTAALDMSPTSSEWNKFLEDSGGHVHDLIHNGEIIKGYRDQWAKEFMEMGFELEFCGYKCFVVNLGHGNADYFGSIIDKYDIVIPYVYDGKQFVVSLYTNDKEIDVSAIAKKCGGGGHAGAAGFTCKELLF